MSMPALFKGRLSLPVIGAPLFIISVPDLVIAQCKAGIVGSFPALNARPPALLDEWLVRVKEELAAHAGGHAGEISPLACVAETRQWFDGPIALSGAIGNGRAIRAARILGADFAYIGSAFIATAEANAVTGYKEMITTSTAEDIVYSNLFTGVHGNYLKPSIVAAGMDPDNLPESDASKMSFGTDASGERAKPKAWKEIWGSGQGVGSVGKIVPAAELIARFKKEYDEAVDPLL